MHMIQLAIPVLLLSFLPLRATAQQPLKYEKVLQIAADELRYLSLDGPAKDLRLTVACKARGAPVDVYLVLEKDREAAAKALIDGKPLQNFVASLKGVEEESTFTVTIKAGAEFTIIIGNCQKKTEVTVKITGK
jgi:hypothetical protein